MTDQKIAGAPIGADPPAPSPPVPAAPPTVSDASPTTVSTPPPPAFAAPVATPAPTYVAPPPAAPEPKVEPEKAAPPLDEQARADLKSAKMTIDEMRQEIEQAKKIRTEFESMRKQQVDENRIAHLRAGGIIGELTDEQILAIAPDVDIDSDAGKLAIEEWRTANGALFAESRLTGKQRSAAIASSLKSSSHGTFGDTLKAKILRETFGGER